MSDYIETTLSRFLDALADIEGELVKERSDSTGRELLRRAYVRLRDLADEYVAETTEFDDWSRLLDDRDLPFGPA